MGDLMIKGSGVFFDIDKFRGPDGMTREYFGPYAWRHEKTEKTSGPDRYLLILPCVNFYFICFRICEFLMAFLQVADFNK